MRKSIALLTILALLGIFVAVWGMSKSVEQKTTEHAHHATPHLIDNAPKVPELSAEAYYAVWIKPDRSEVVLADKNSTSSKPIASVTKLMTALVAHLDISPGKQITISRDAEKQFEVAGQVKSGEVYPVEALFEPLLIESSNDIAYAMAETVGLKKFLADMNTHAKALGMHTTHYSTVHGLDAQGVNTSSLHDISKLFSHLYFDPILRQKILYPTTVIKRDFPRPTSSKDRTLRTLNTTNEVLTSSEIHEKIVGGKTGETPKALQALVIGTEAPHHDGVIFYGVLRSHDRAADMISLVKWVESSYNW